MSNETLPIFARITDGLRDRFEDWRRAQPTIPSRSEALRSLLNKALESERSQPARRIADTAT